MSGSKTGEITYLDIDSTYRNRKTHPNPADFRVNFTNVRQNRDISTSRNIIADSYPYYQWQWGCTTVANNGSGLANADRTFFGRLGGNAIEAVLPDGAVDDIVFIANDTQIPTTTLGNPGQFNGANPNTRITTNITQSDDFFTGCELNSLELVDDNAGDQLRAPDIRNNTFITSYKAIRTTCTISGHLYDEQSGNNYFTITNPTVIDDHGDNDPANDTSTQIFVPGGSNKSGDYVGDFYEAVLRRAGQITPDVHQFSKIIAYDVETKILTLEDDLNITNPANRLLQAGAVYLNRIRKERPLLPQSAAGLVENMPRINANGVAGAVFKATVANGGTNYTVNDLIGIAGATVALFVVTSVNNGVVTDVEIFDCGAGIQSGTNDTNNVQVAAQPTGLTLTVSVGTGINVDGAGNGSVEENPGAYTNKLFYCPAFSTTGNLVIAADPSAAQQFIPQNQTVQPELGYFDTDHATFPILGHFVNPGDNRNMIVVKTVDTPTIFQAAAEFNILEYTEDGVEDMVNHTYRNPQRLSNKYEIDLINLTIPNKVLETGPGGFIANHSYVMVEFFCDSYNKSHVYNTNNPKLENVLFKCIVKDTSNPSSVPFVKFSSDYPVVTQFRLDDSVSFRIMLPNGETLRTVSKDSVPPARPKKELQISATLKITEV